MDNRWGEETERVRRSFDAVADRYREEFAHELDYKPFDRDFLDALAQRLSDGRPVLEVGGGNGHIGDYLAERSVRTIVSDVSLGQLKEGASTRRVACDLARLPARPGSLAAIVAFYCLIYGPPEHLDAVFAEWHDALEPGGLIAFAVHAGEGSVHIDEWWDRPVDITVVLRDPDDMVVRVERNGFVVEQRTVRAPYEEEHATDRLYVVAARD